MPRQLLLLNVVLATVAVGAAAFIVAEVTMPPRAAPLRARATPEASPPPPETEKAPAVSGGSYAVVASRNLFSPTRNEAAVPPPAGRQATVAMPKPTLHGVVLRDGTPVAYLEDPTTKRVAGYRLGDSIAGGTLKAINGDHVVLNRPEGAVDVRLRDPAKPRPPAPPAVTAQPRRDTPPPGPGVPPAGAPAPPAPMIGPDPTIGQQEIVPGQPGQPVTPPRRMLPPNVLRRVPPPASDATE